jgi:ubiquitin-protein ligase
MSISALAVRRITIDTTRAMDLTDNGLFWIPDETDMTHGWAIICGPEDSPYYGGSFCFEVKFPDDYPFSPPVFNYLTNDGRTRFNPNLYKNGKVCLSLLNTWQGEPWSGVQSLSSVLQSIQTAVLNEEPLRNEPAYATISTHRDFAVYNRMVFHSTLETAILSHMAEPPPCLVPVYEPFRDHAIKAIPFLIKKAKELAAEWDGKTEIMEFFGMSVKYRFGKLVERLEVLVSTVAASEPEMAASGGAGSAAGGPTSGPDVSHLGTAVATTGGPTSGTVVSLATEAVAP